MSASEVAPRRLDLLMPDGLWYRTIESYADNAHELEPVLSHHGTFIACSGEDAGSETFVRASVVQALRWVNEGPG